MAPCKCTFSGTNKLDFKKRFSIILECFSYSENDRRFKRDYNMTAVNGTKTTIIVASNAATMTEDTMTTVQ